MQLSIYVSIPFSFRSSERSKLDDYYFKIVHFREKSAIKKISMEGLSYHKQTDNSTRNDGNEAEDSQSEFSKTIKNKTGKFKTPARNNSINQTPKLIGLSKLVGQYHLTPLIIVRF